MIGFEKTLSETNSTQLNNGFGSIQQPVVGTQSNNQSQQTKNPFTFSNSETNSTPRNTEFGSIQQPLVGTQPNNGNQQPKNPFTFGTTQKTVFGFGSDTNLFASK
ncbi:hypothetical protein ACF0H5_014324 [Mactra antiquata]